MADKITVYHNPRCSKSRMALHYLDEHNQPYEVIEYMQSLPSKEELKTVIAQLGIRPEELVRKGEADYKEHFKGKDMTDDEWLDAFIRFPKLIERPIVIKSGRAVIARPTERIDEIL